MKYHISVSSSEFHSFQSQTEGTQAAASFKYDESLRKHNFKS